MSTEELLSLDARSKLVAALNADAIENAAVTRVAVAESARRIESGHFSGEALFTKAVSIDGLTVRLAKDEPLRPFARE